MLDLDVVSKIVALVVATIGAGTTIYNIFFKGEHKRKQEYYECLLKPFATAHQRDRTIDAVAFVKKIANRDNDSIPKYIFHLVDAEDACDNGDFPQGEPQKQPENETTNESSQEYSKLTKVLIYDYLLFYPNEYNRKLNLFDAVLNLLNYIVFLLTYFFLFMGAIQITSGIITILRLPFVEGGAASADWWKAIISVLVGIAISFAGLIPIKLSEWFSKDMYAVKKKRIETMIDKKIKGFDKRFNKYII